eukprot:CAMPEP_0115388464 /NCGR_PEP_ID=MMETSP0271-20121206/9184_1 /TAXON_ID=71861 /ORGANISM="Scrippsiella trochoidea, Strain CCMP3099" /LENGTH=483 /DNA_ID=CAMNT_0002811945 /DNA_START=83 /DNA_END=1534 /DNA_ORIENTATION=+
MTHAVFCSVWLVHLVAFSSAFPAEYSEAACPSGLEEDAARGSGLIQTETTVGKSRGPATLVVSKKKASPEERPPPRVRKMGLACSNGYAFQPGSGCTVTHLQAFTDPAQLGNSDGAQFYYNYQLSVPASVQQWMISHDVEFVPMVGWRHIWLNAPGAPSHDACQHVPANVECRCYFTDAALAPQSAPGRSGPMCSLRDLVDTVRETMSTLSGKAKPRYLMGFNEPEDSRAKHKNMSPHEAVEYWRRFVQPAAVELDLALVSPTVSEGLCKQHEYGCQLKGTWYANFLKACWDQREDQEFPCDVEKIAAVSVHLHQCMEDTWTRLFSQGTGQFFRDMKQQMQAYGGKDWDAFIDSRKIWVTEFSCNDDSLGYGALDSMPLASSADMCRQLTGQAETWKAGKKSQSWGKGAVHALEDLESITRYAWRNTWAPGKSSAGASAMLSHDRLVDDAGRPFSHGLAMLQGLDQVNCSQGAHAASAPLLQL